jgi:hypothetical protein
LIIIFSFPSLQTIARRVVGQIAQDGNPDDRQPRPSDLLHEMLKDLDTLREEIVGGVKSMESESRRAVNTAQVYFTLYRPHKL